MTANDFETINSQMAVIRRTNPPDSREAVFAGAIQCILEAVVALEKRMAKVEHEGHDSTM